MTCHWPPSALPLPDHSRETEIYHVSAGHLFLLRCHNVDARARVVWSRGDRGDLSLPTGVEVRDGLLWFLPVQLSHNGIYTCEKRDGTRFFRMKFWVLVSSGECPDASDTKGFMMNVSGSLPCQQKEIFRLNNISNIRWMKDSHPVQQPISLNANGDARLTPTSERDAGKYTCLVDINLDGRKYTAARSIQLNITDVSIIPLPQIVLLQEVVMVKLGTRVELKCEAYVGLMEDSETTMYWTVKGTFTEDYEELSESWKYFHDRGRVFGKSTLSISKVVHHFLNVPIKCHVMTPTGAKEGLVCLQEADHSAFHMTVALCLAAFLVVLVLTASFFFFKVDLVLAYRKLLTHFPKKQVSDGKLFDAYVSYFHPDTLSSHETESFALQILPKELEGQHGYSLYIRGRDDCPGEAVHNVIAATIHQCRRLIIILSSDGKTREASHICDNQNQLCYEQKVGLFDALTRNDLQVILVEIDGPVDYSHLPESLRYIKRKQGALKWKKVFPGSHKLTKLNSNRNFWKNLRYHMPPVPERRLQTRLLSKPSEV
ncbi:interleukin-1 receptor type 1 [Brachyistius frenatus]|uniref:interleukin-1 receptor type 1 n=1 Tax=Brachyistius frenatus TaxID=100188 RepID=UPI0037E99EE8